MQFIRIFANRFQHAHQIDIRRYGKSHHQIKPARGYIIYADSLAQRLQAGDFDQVHHRTVRIAEAIDQFLDQIIAAVLRTDGRDLFVHLHAQHIVRYVFLRKVGVHLHIHAGFHIAHRSIAAHFAHRVLDHLHIHIIADRRHKAALLTAQQIARAADLQIAHRDAEARSEFGKFADGVQALIRRFGKHLVRADGKIRIRQSIAAPHAPAQLIQLGKPELIRIAHDQRVRALHIQTGFDDRGTQKHIEFSLIEIQHHIFQRVLPHLTVTYGDSRFGHQPLQPRIHHFDGLHAVVQHIYLPAAPQFAHDGVAHQPIGIFHHVGLHGIALLRRGLQKAHIANAHHGHVQRSGNRRGGQRQYIDALLQPLDGFLVGHAEALFLIHHQQPQILKFHILRQQPVRADDHIDRSFLQILQYLFLFRRGFKPAQHLDVHRKAREAVQHRGVMLLHQNRSRREHGGLFAAHHRLEHGAERNLRLAIAHIAAQQAIHHARTFHIALDIFDRRQLIRRFLVGEIILEFALPRGIRFERIARHGFALGI